MTGQYAQNQRTMEEILASIRKTIEVDVRKSQEREAPTLRVVPPVADAVSAPVPDHQPSLSLTTPVSEPLVSSAAPQQSVFQHVPERSILSENAFELTQVVNDDGSVTALRQQQDPLVSATPATAPMPATPSISVIPTPISPTYVAKKIEEAPVMTQPPEPTEQEPEILLTQEPPQAGQGDIDAMFDAPASVAAAAVPPAPATPAAPSQPASVEGVAPVSGPSFQAMQSPAVAPSAPQMASVASGMGDGVSSPGMGAPTSVENATMGTLVSDEVMKASAQALSDLTGAIHSKAAQALSSQSMGGYTVEELMRELLRPMLKEWLDAHLPSLVKWIVTEQIEKMVKNLSEPQ